MRSRPRRRQAMRKSHLSVAGLSVLFALGLAVWEVYFFWFAGAFKSLEGKLGLFTPDRLGFNMAWLAAIYLSYQLIAMFGKPHLVATPQRWEAALLLIFVTLVDLFGGYTFNIALSRRIMDIAPATSS